VIFSPFPAIESTKQGEKFEFNSNQSRSISLSEIKDRSKGDSLAKTLVLFQLAWFSVQVIARAVEHITVTALEITTIAYILVSAILYAIWWHKPKGVRYPLTVRLSPSAPIERYKEIDQPEENRDCRQLDQKCFRQKSIQVYKAFYLFFTSSGDYEHDTSRSQQIPEFYSGYSKADHTGDVITCNLCLLAEMMLGFIFGVVHCCAWFFDFQSAAERRIWRISALVVTFEPVLVMLTTVYIVILYTRIKSFRFTIEDVLHPTSCGYWSSTARVMEWTAKSSLVLAHYTLFTCAAVGALGYVIARFMLLAITFSSLRHLPPGALSVVEWTTLFPHFG